MKKTLLKTIYNLGGFALFQRARPADLCILMYHRFSRKPDRYKISAAEFEAHLVYLKKHHRVLSLPEAIEHLKTGEPLPPNAAVITIDDGYADAYEIAFPILKRCEMPATLYAVTDFLDCRVWLWTDLTRYILSKTKADFLQIEFAENDKIELRLTDRAQRLETANRINARLKRMPNEQKAAKIKEIAERLKVFVPDAPVEDYAPVSWKQAREMDAGHLRVESHTVTHPILTNINQLDLDYELQASKNRLENQLDREVRNFCYPNGTMNPAVERAVEKAGYESAVTTEYGTNGKDADPFALKRIDAPPAIEDFAQGASGFAAFRQSIKK